MVLPLGIIFGLRDIACIRRKLLELNASGISLLECLPFWALISRNTVLVYHSKSFCQSIRIQLPS
jgi:hypothetical protein